MNDFENIEISLFRSLQPHSLWYNFILCAENPTANYDIKELHNSIFV